MERCSLHLSFSLKNWDGDAYILPAPCRQKCIYCITMFGHCAVSTHVKSRRVSSCVDLKSHTGTPTAIHRVIWVHMDFSASLCLRECSNMAFCMRHSRIQIRCPSILLLGNGRIQIGRSVLHTCTYNTRLQLRCRYTMVYVRFFVKTMFRFTATSCNIIDLSIVS